jgi:hypothetical protein
MKITFDYTHKKIIKIKKIVTILMLAVFTISCGGGNDSSPPTPTPSSNTNFIKATIDGANYEVTGNQITALQDSVAFSFISYITGGGTGFDISVLGTTAVGTYNFNTAALTTVGRLNYRINTDIFSTAFCPTSSGTLTITSKNGNTIEGTFSFIAKKSRGCSDASKVITNGTFRITYS